MSIPSADIQNLQGQIAALEAMVAGLMANNRAALAVLPTLQVRSAEGDPASVAYCNGFMAVAGRLRAVWQRTKARRDARQEAEEAAMEAAIEADRMAGAEPSRAVGGVLQ